MRFLWDFVFVLVFAGAAYIFLKTPLKRRRAAPDWADPFAGFLLTVCVLLYIYFAHYAMNLIPESDYAPCGRLSRQIECYNLTQETCMVAWHSSSGDCDDQVEEQRRQRPTALLGQFRELCISRNFDKLMFYNRKNQDTSSCRSYFQRVGKQD
ncbi:MAG: hypothetical protein ACK5Y2_12885 [Bdellovibrionales bacterium]